MQWRRWEDGVFMIEEAGTASIRESTVTHHAEARLNSHGLGKRTNRWSKAECISTFAKSFAILRLRL